MSGITSTDGTEIFYKDAGSGQPIVFSHGWPLNADAWEAQLTFFAQQGYRAIAHDRRSHGRSAQTADGHHMDQFADDLAALIDQLDLHNVVLVGSSMGGGEVVRYLARHGSVRAVKAVLVGSMPPLMLKTDDNPEGAPMEIFDGFRKAITDNRAQVFKDMAVPYYGLNRMDAKAPEDLRETFWRLGMMGGLKGQVDCIRAFSETDLSTDLKGIEIPVLILHGDDDQMVPIDLGAKPMAKLLPQATLKIYPGGDHGLAQTHPGQVNADIQDFIRS